MMTHITRCYVNPDVEITGESEGTGRTVDLL